MTAVAPAQRFTVRSPCPICSGHAGLPQGHGRRCWGFRSEDGLYAHCSREEHAGGLLAGPDGMYAHRLAGSCSCGSEHGSAPALRVRPNGVAQRVVRETVYRVGDFEHVRQDHEDGSKSMYWRLDGTPGLGGVPVADLPLYGVEALPEAPAGSTVLVVEGEKVTDALRGQGFFAVGTVTGAKSCPSKVSLELLRGYAVVLWPDADADGQAHMGRIGERLQSMGIASRIFTWAEAPEHGDAADYFERGGTGDELRALLDAMDVGTSGQATGSDVLDEVEAFLGRFVSYPSEHTHVAHVLWIGHTHLMDAWETTPRLAFLSPEPASGKTRALEVSELLVPRPVEAVNVTPAYLFRKVADPAGRPTILFDEIDTVFGPRAKENEEIRGLLNAGHRVGAVAGRCVIRGKRVETEEIPAYCAVAMAGLGGVPDTILSRSIIVRMRRRAPGEPIEPYRRRVHAPEGHAIRDMLAAWVCCTVADVADSQPDIPTGIEDRDADLWESLLSVADAAGGEWPERARVAAVALVADSKRSTPSLGIRLLADLRVVFGGRGALATTAILEALCALDESPWEEIAAGKPLSARGLAQRLRKYEVSSRTIRVGNTTPRGYTREDLADAWSRYLSPSPPEECATSATCATELQEELL